MPDLCPLCSSSKTDIFHSLTNRSGRKDFCLCSECDLIFVPSAYHPSEEDEIKRYELHRNTPDDEGYRNFLNGFAESLIPFLKKNTHGLDYGCGPYPLLAEILKSRSLSVDIFDKYFFNDPVLLKKQYGFITCTETIEHFRDPGKEFDRLDSILQAGGHLGIMTGILEDREDFAGWHYIQDITHLAFYSMKTFEWIGQNYNWEIVLFRDDIVIFRKN
ncbi:class I SAM-dependent methyltransferase [candidate division KSB1 bacterium]